jgi:hypothetical protein
VLAALIVLLTATAGSGAQATSGFGLSLLLSPVLQLLVPGPGSVRLLNALGVVLNVVVLARTGRHIHWAATLLLAGPAIAATLAIEPLLAGGSHTTVAVLAAAATLIAVALTALGRTPAVLMGAAGAIASGVLCGALTATSGTGGPPIAAHVATRPWSRRSLVATVQAVFLPANIAAVLAGHGQSGAPTVLAAAAGLAVGYLLAARFGSLVSPRAIRLFVLISAALGASVVLLRAL